MANRNKPPGWSRTNTLLSNNIFKEWTRRGYSSVIAIVRFDKRSYTIINGDECVLGRRDNMHEAHMLAYASMTKIVTEFEQREALRLAKEPEWDGDDSCGHRTVGGKCDVHKKEVICGYLGPFIHWCCMRTAVPVERLETRVMVG